MDISFVRAAPAMHVVFGHGTLPRVADEARRLGLRRLLVLCGREQQALGGRVHGLLGDLSVGVFAGAAMHTPVAVTLQALAIAREREADGLVAVGGGSSVGLGKAIALRTDLPQIVVPTTYAGSEMTPLLGETENQVKTTQRSAKVLPESVVYDVQLTLGLPAALSAASGMNAMAHAVEALYAPENDPVVALMAEEGVRALFASLEQVVLDPADVAARHQALYGAWLCACCLGQATMGLHHKLCHVLGGLYNLPHAAMHAVLLPHMLAFNSAHAGPACTRLQRATGHENPAHALRALNRACGLPASLRDIGMPQAGVVAAADAVLAQARAVVNPRPVEREGLLRLLGCAWAGEDLA